MFLGLMIFLLAVLIGATVRIFAVTRRIQAALSPDEFASWYKTHYLGMSAETPPGPVKRTECQGRLACLRWAPDDA